MKEINEVVKELCCGIATCDSEAFLHGFEHPDYILRQDAFVVINNNGELFEVKVSKIKGD